LDSLERPFVELVPGLPRGLAEAACEFVQGFAPTVEQFAANRIKPSLQGLVSPGDITQEVWHRFFENLAQLPELKDADHAAAYLLCIAHRCLADASRKLLGRGGRPPHFEPMDDWLEGTLRDAVPTPPELATCRERFALVKQRAQTDQRYVALLLYALDNEPKDIAAMLAFSPDHVRRILHEASRELREEGFGC
jgi:DNA-directed RNA polymerase specialized sigma24 family protein